MKMKLLFSTLGFMLLLTNLFSQKTINHKYSIPKGQFLFTKEIKGNENLSSYEKIFMEEYNGKRTKVIEIGDYVLKKKKLGTDTLSYKIQTLRITQGDTLIEEKILELKKELSYDAKVHLEFTKNRILIYQTEENNKGIKIPKTKEYVHPTDKELYYKIEDSKPLKFESYGVNSKIMMFPAKIRLSSKIDSIRMGEFRINNVGLFVGIGSRSYKYENGKLKKRGISYGPYIGFSSIRINNENTLEEIASEKERLGIIIGGCLVREINNFNIGIGFGFERVIKEDNYNWIFNKKGFVGIVVGYTLN